MNMKFGFAASDWVFRLALLALSVVWPMSALASPGPATEIEAQRLVHLLGYVAGDYGGAVAGGVVKDEMEYAEQLSLLAEGERIARALSTAPGAPEDLASAVAEVHKLALAKANEAEVARATRALTEKIKQAFHVAESPAQPPDAARGEALFGERCASCHGDTGRGDTPLAAQLKPPPMNFHDPKVADGLSPFRVFTTVRFGIEGTAMAPVPDLSDADRWNLAFYVTALRHAGAATADAPPHSLAELTTHSDGELQQELRATGADDAKVSAMLAQLRVRAPYEVHEGSLAIARTKLEQARTALAEGNRDKARSFVIDAYLDGVEPIEGSLRAHAPALTHELEERFRTLRSGLQRGDKPSAVSQSIEEALREVARAEVALDEAAQGESFTTTTLKSASILLREGVEAALLLAALLGLATQAGLADKRRFIHLGWVVALGAGLVTWVVSSRLIAISGANREMIEGATALLAASVLFYVSYSLIAKREVARWMAFLREQISPRKAAISLFGVAFLAVYREAFETVLFYQALLAQNASKTATLAGVVGASVVLVIVILGYTRAGRFAPPQVFFRVSSYLLYGLAVVFVGQGIAALQTVGVIPVHFVPLPSVSALGVFPTIETYAAQFTLIAAAVIGARVGKKDAPHAGASTSKPQTR
jgi:high-affinity iron transporter